MAQVYITVHPDHKQQGGKTMGVARVDVIDPIDDKVQKIFEELREYEESRSIAAAMGGKRLRVVIVENGTTTKDQFEDGTRQSKTTRLADLPGFKTGEIQALLHILPDTPVKQGPPSPNKSSTSTKAGTKRSNRDINAETEGQAKRDQMVLRAELVELQNVVKQSVDSVGTAGTTGQRAAARIIEVQKMLAETEEPAAKKGGEKGEKRVQIQTPSTSHAAPQSPGTPAPLCAPTEQPNTGERLRQVIVPDAGRNKEAGKEGASTSIGMGGLQVNENPNGDTIMGGTEEAY